MTDHQSTPTSVQSPDFWAGMDPDLQCQDPALKEIHAYWNQKRGDRPFPSRRDIDPMDLKPQLGNLILIDVEHDPLRLRYRLIGTRITAIMKRDVTKKYYDEVYPDEVLDSIYRSFEWMIEHGKPIRTCGKSLYPDLNFYAYEALHLPLSSDGTVIDMVLGGLVNHPIDEPR